MVQIRAKGTDALPHGSEYWIWSTPWLTTQELIDVGNYREGMLPHLEGVPRIHLNCQMMRTYLISGKSGQWIVDHQRGFVVYDVDDTLKRIRGMDIWTSIPFEVPAADDHERAKTHRRSKI